MGLVGVSGVIFPPKNIYMTQHNIYMTHLFDTTVSTNAVNYWPSARSLLSRFSYVRTGTEKFQTHLQICVSFKEYLLRYNLN